MKNIIAVSKEGVTIKDSAALKNMMDGLIYEAVFSEGEKKNALLILLKEIAKAAGAIPASTRAPWTQRFTPSGFGAVMVPPIRCPPQLTTPPRTSA